MGPILLPAVAAGAFVKGVAAGLVIAGFGLCACRALCRARARDGQAPDSESEGAEPKSAA